EGGWIEDDKGNRLTARDVHMRKVALGETWEEYKAGRLSATHVEAMWQEMDTPEFRDEMRKKHEAFKGLLDDIEARTEVAGQARDEACDKAAEAREKVGEACAAAEAAKKAYEECVAAEVAVVGGAVADTAGAE
ncbi:MAG: hypothetical protein ACC658_16630, partial [Acidimicrobiia bacterium]